MIVPHLTLIHDRRGRGSRTKPASVELCVYADGKRKYLSTGVKLLKKEWSNGQVNACRPDYQELNKQLHLFMQTCGQLVARMLESGTLDINALPRMMEEELKQSHTFLDYAKDVAELRYPKMSKGTKEHYLLLFKFLESWRGIVYFSDVNDRQILRMDKELADRGLKECSRWNYHRHLKTFILQAIEDGLVTRNPYARLDLKKGNENGLTRFLTPTEFHRFESCEIRIERLQRVRDLFVFQTYTLMSYTDLADFDYSKCVEVNGQMVYKEKRNKTGQEFMIPLVQPAINILKRYNNKLPIISNVKYNEYLKAAVMYAGIDKPVSTHWARHTGATMLLNEGNISMHVVQHILGHSTIRETEKTYAKVLDSTIIDSMAGFDSKFKAQKKGRTK